MTSTILNDIVRDFSTVWFSALGPIEHRMFWILVTIQLTWSVIWCTSNLTQVSTKPGQVQVETLTRAGTVASRAEWNRS